MVWKQLNIHMLKKKKLLQTIPLTIHKNELYITGLTDANPQNIKFLEEIILILKKAKNFLAVRLKARSIKGQKL